MLLDLNTYATTVISGFLKAKYLWFTEKKSFEMKSLKPDVNIHFLKETSAYIMGLQSDQKVGCLTVGKSQLIP